MKILIALDKRIPVETDGGIERIAWWLGKELIRNGHEVVYLAKSGSKCPFAKVIEYDNKKPLFIQIPKDVDIAHFHFMHEEELECPVLFTLHRNAESNTENLHPNTVFLSRNHALRHGGKHFVYNGLDFDDYGTPDLERRRRYFHFLANTDWHVKNLQGAIEIATTAEERLHVIGGSRINLRAGRFTLNHNVRFHGLLGGQGKNVIINGSKGLIFPVLWHEPFGLNIIESLYFGCPLFGTPNGSLPELLGGDSSKFIDHTKEFSTFYSEFGVLSKKTSELVEALQRSEAHDRKKCQAYVVDCFSSKVMAKNYLAYYERILNGEVLHKNMDGGESAPNSQALELAPG